MAELSGRSVAYGYDSLYRLTSETVSADPNNKNGAINYTYDAVGNRKTLNATLPPAGGISYTYDADDRLGSDQYDSNGNTILSAGISDVYDFENHLIQKGGVTIVYDGDGNRATETVAGVTTNYLVDTVNPTGYAQVVDELQNGTVTRTYSYGLERISENQTISSAWTPSFYGYDGHGSVRQLTNTAGAVTDSYDYDAFGNLNNSTGTTPNNYLFASEQYDPALGLYYNRARYLNTTTGRFWSMDTTQGDDEDPTSLHKYLFAEADPVDNTDRSGNEIDEVIGSLGVMNTINSISLPTSDPLGLKAPTYDITENLLRKGQNIGFYKEFDIAFTVDPGLIDRYMIVQWIKGSFTLNGTPLSAPHQGMEPDPPVNFKDWVIDSASLLAEYPGNANNNTLQRFPTRGKILMSDEPGHQGHIASGTWAADLDFKVNVYDRLTVANEVSAFRGVNDPKPLLSVDWNFHDSYKVP